MTERERVFVSLGFSTAAFWRKNTKPGGRIGMGRVSWDLHKGVTLIRRGSVWGDGKIVLLEYNEIHPVVARHRWSSSQYEEAKVSSR